MTDIGLLNYVKNQIASGKSKEEIASTLIKSGNWQQDQINEAFVEAQSNNILIKQPLNSLLGQDLAKNRKNVIILAFVIIGILAGGFFLSKNLFHPKPLVSEITPLLKTFLGKNRNDCDKTTLKNLSNVNIGSYVKELKMGLEGFPVYADSEVECTKIDNSRSYPMKSTYSYKTKSNNKTAIVYAKQVNDKWTVYIPDFFKNAENQLQNELDKIKI